jgi:hypothetical protein
MQLGVQSACHRGSTTDEDLDRVWNADHLGT